MTPRKTIYVPKDKQGVFEKAQEALGEDSASSAIIASLEASIKGRSEKASKQVGKSFRYELEIDNKHDLAKQIKAIPGVTVRNACTLVRELEDIGRIVHLRPGRENEEIEP